MHANSIRLMKRFVDNYVTNIPGSEVKVVDVGSQDVNGTYKHLFEDCRYKYTGIDMCPGRNVDIVLSDVYNWNEISPESVDVVICGQAFEHIEYIWNTIIEITRIMKENSYCCIIVPAVCLEHKYPLDCWRFYSDGLKALSKFAGLEVVEVYSDYECINPGMVDSILIARKPILLDSEKIKLEEKINLVRKLAKDYEINI